MKNKNPVLLFLSSIIKSFYSEEFYQKMAFTPWKMIVLKFIIPLSLLVTVIQVGIMSYVLSLQHPIGNSYFFFAFVTAMMLFWCLVELVLSSLCAAVFSAMIFSLTTSPNFNSRYSVALVACMPGIIANVLPFKIFHSMIFLSSASILFYMKKRVSFEEKMAVQG